MRTGLLAVILAALFAVGVPVLAAPIQGQGDPLDAIPDGTVTDFEDATPGTYTDLDYDGLNITGDDDFYISSEYAGAYNTRGELSLQTYGGTGEAQSFTIVFSVPVAQFAFLFGASDDVWRITAYDSDDGVIETTDIPEVGNSNEGDYFGISADSAVIAYFTVENFEGSGDYVMIDNLTYTATPGAEDTALSLKEDAYDRLEELLPTGNKYIDEAIERALDRIEDSLDEDFWLDDNRLTDDGKRVFELERSAVHTLNWALRVPGIDEDDEAAIEDSIADLVEADRLLAFTALEDAADLFEVGASAERLLNRADDYYDKGLGMVEEEKSYDAITQFKKAWEICARLLDSIPA